MIPPFISSGDHLKYLPELNYYVAPRRFNITIPPVKRCFFFLKNILYSYVIFNILKNLRNYTVTIWLVRTLKSLLLANDRNLIAFVLEELFRRFYFGKVEQLLFLRLWQIFQPWIKRNLLASPNTEQWTLIKPTVNRQEKY